MSALIGEIAQRIVVGITGGGLLLSGVAPAFLLSWAIVVR